MSVRKRGNQWVVTTKDGKRVLGHHHSAEEAYRQLRAIEASKHRKGGRMQPHKPMHK